MLDLQTQSYVLQTIPCAFMFMYLYLNRIGVYDRLLGKMAGQSIISSRLKQKDLMEFGSVQMLVAAVASSFTEHVSTTITFVIFAFVFMGSGYFTLTLLQLNVFYWVKSDLSCVSYVIMIYIISIGAQSFTLGLSNPWLIATAVAVAILIFIVEIIHPPKNDIPACPSCNASTFQGDKYCGNCGRLL